MRRRVKLSRHTSPHCLIAIFASLILAERRRDSSSHVLLTYLNYSKQAFAFSVGRLPKDIGHSSRWLLRGGITTVEIPKRIFESNM